MGSFIWDLVKDWLVLRYLKKETMEFTGDPYYDNLNIDSLTLNF